MEEILSIFKVFVNLEDVSTKLSKISRDRHIIHIHISRLDIDLEDNLFINLRNLENVLRVGYHDNKSQFPGIPPEYGYYVDFLKNS